MRLKKKNFGGLRFVGIGGILLVILVFLVSPGNSFLFTGEIEPSDHVNEQLDCTDSVKCFDQLQADIQSQSIIKSVKLAESDSSIVTKFLDEQKINSPLGTEKFGIQTEVALFDSDKKQIPVKNDIIGVPQLSVVDEHGNTYDLGLIDVSFSGVTASPEASVSVSGDVVFILDDIVIKTKKIWAESSSKQTVIPLSIVDMIPPSFAERSPNFTFTLSDEGRDWKDGDLHYYRVVLKNIQADLNSNKDFKTFKWSGEHIAYELKVKVDGTKKVIVDPENAEKTIQIFKSDDTLSVTSSVYAYTWSSVCFNKICPSKPVMPLLKEPLSVYIKSSNKLLGIVDNSFFVPNESQTKACGGYPRVTCGTVYVAKPYWKNSILKDIPRGTTLLIKSPTKTVEFTTPESQLNLSVYCDFSKCSSNFNYFYP